jgi:hypothetical protein
MDATGDGWTQTGNDIHVRGTVIVNGTHKQRKRGHLDYASSFQLDGGLMSSGRELGNGTDRKRFLVPKYCLSIGFSQTMKAEILSAYRPGK